MIYKSHQRFVFDLFYYSSTPTYSLNFEQTNTLSYENKVLIQKRHLLKIIRNEQSHEYFAQVEFYSKNKVKIPQSVVHKKPTTPNICYENLKIAF